MKFSHKENVNNIVQCPFKRKGVVFWLCSLLLGNDMISEVKTCKMPIGGYFGKYGQDHVYVLKVILQVPVDKQVVPSPGIKSSVTRYQRFR